MQINLDDMVIHDNETAQQFETVIDAYIALMQYRLADNTIIFTHTKVPEELEGQGIGSKLVQTGLEAAQSRGLKVAPICPFVASFIREHPEYHPLIHPKYKDQVLK